MVECADKAPHEILNRHFVFANGQKLPPLFIIYYLKKEVLHENFQKPHFDQTRG